MYRTLLGDEIMAEENNNIKNKETRQEVEEKNVNKNKKNSMQSKNKIESTDKERKTTWILIGFLIVLLFAAVYLAFSSGTFTFDTVQSYSTTVIADKTTESGENKTVKVTCDIEANPKEVDQKSVDESVQSVVEKYSYEQLTGDNAMDSLKNSIITELQKQVGFENVSSIYLSEYDTDYSGNGNSQYSEGQEQRNRNMKGLFPNMK